MHWRHSREFILGMITARTTIKSPNLNNSIEPHFKSELKLLRLAVLGDVLAPSSQPPATPGFASSTLKSTRKKRSQRLTI